MSDILDLDIIRPPRKIIKLGGKEIDVSIIPCGITFEIDSIVRAFAQVDQGEINKGSADEIHKALDLTIKLCATFTKMNHPEMTEEWFRVNVDALQVKRMAEIIKDALQQSYAGVKEYGKN